jgi:SagB-type dehydrogenase family enzyme
MTGTKYLMISMGTLFLSLVLMGSEVKAGEAKDDRIKLPAPRYESKTSLEKALRERRSVREFKKETLTLSEIAQLLWSAQGITASGGLRTAPSAGALYPLEVYIIVGNVTNMKSGIYKYIPESHELVKVIEGDKRSEMSKAALHQSPITDAPAVIVFSAVYERTSGKYGERGIRYVQMEAGHAAQNILLQAVSLNLGAVVMGAFEDDKVERAMDMKPDEKLLYVIPVGRCKIP